MLAVVRLRKSQDLRVLQNRPDHLIAHPRRLGKPRRKELLNAFEPIPIALKGAKADTVRPTLCQSQRSALNFLKGRQIITHSSCKCELQVVGAEGVVVNSSTEDFVEQIGFPEKILGDAEPEPEQLDMDSISLGRFGLDGK